MMKLFHEMTSWGGCNLISGMEKKARRLAARFPNLVPQNSQTASHVGIRPVFVSFKTCMSYTCAPMM